jgi:polyhydroxyalkanoate synthesis regulator phasin
VVDPRDVVVITRARLQEVVDGAVARGRMSRADAAELLDELVTVPRDLARRVSGKLPIAGYDDLTAAQITARLGDLTPAELRRVRDYERRNANRKTVLAAIDHRID